VTDTHHQAVWVEVVAQVRQDLFPNLLPQDKGELVYPRSFRIQYQDSLVLLAQAQVDGLPAEVAVATVPVLFQGASVAPAAEVQVI
jgi:hypothetical protein